MNYFYVGGLVEDMDVMLGATDGSAVEGSDFPGAYRNVYILISLYFTSLMLGLLFKYPFFLCHYD